MSPKPSRMVALVAALALAACSSIGTINGQRIDGRATPNETGPAPPRSYPCQDLEWACFAVVASIATLAVLLTTQDTNKGPGSH